MTVHLANTPVLETTRLTLRAPQAGDWPAWRRMMASDRSRFIRTPDIDDGKAWRAFGHVIGHWVMRDWGSFVFTLKGDTTPLGMAGPWFPDGWTEKEIGWSLWSPGAEGHGYAAEAASAAIAYAFDTLGWDTAVSYIEPDNTRSISLAQRLGAARDARAEAAYDDTLQVWRHPRPEDV